MDLPTDYTKLNSREKRKVRLEYEHWQNGKCMHCGVSLADKPKMDKKINWKLFPKGFLDYPVHLQHCHKTNMTEGAVHAYCNAVLWQYHGR